MYSVNFRKSIFIIHMLIVLKNLVCKNALKAYGAVRKESVQFINFTAFLEKSLNDFSLHSIITPTSVVEKCTFFMSASVKRM